MFMLTGTTDGLPWSIQGRESVDKRYYALVQVGNTKKVTNNTYVTQEAAKDAGCQLMADTLAELLDEVQHA